MACKINASCAQRRHNIRGLWSLTSEAGYEATPWQIRVRAMCASEESLHASLGLDLCNLVQGTQDKSGKKNKQFLFFLSFCVIRDHDTNSDSMLTTNFQGLPLHMMTW